MNNWLTQMQQALSNNGFKFSNEISINDMNGSIKGEAASAVFLGQSLLIVFADKSLTVQSLEELNAIL